MSSRSERLLQNWKGAQSILKLRKRYQIPIVAGMGFTVYLSLGGFATGNIIFAGLGLISAGIYTFLFITMTDVILTRSRKEKQLRKKQEKINEVINIVTDYAKDINDTIFKDALMKALAYLKGLPDDPSMQTVDPFNEAWKNRIRNIESNDLAKEQIIKELQQKIANEITKREKVELDLQTSSANVQELREELKRLKGE